MVVHAAESLYWCNTTEPPYLINGASNIARVTSHNRRYQYLLISIKRALPVFIDINKEGSTSISIY